ncbi:unnamed protein product [Closterium sp. Naga37s-1]|nr:unnamed protein product [Closterium sp. Naga37s-1]
MFSICTIPPSHPLLLSDTHCRDLSYTGLAGSVPWGINSLGQLHALYGTPSIFCNDNATCAAALLPPTSPLPPPTQPANPTSPAVTESTSIGSANLSAPNTTCHVCQSYCLGCSSSASGASPEASAPSVPPSLRLPPSPSTSFHPEPTLSQSFVSLAIFSSTFSSVIAIAYLFYLPRSHSGGGTHCTRRPCPPRLSLCRFVPCTAPPPASNSALSLGAIAAIVVAALVALISLIVLIILIWFYFRRSKPGEAMVRLQYAESTTTLASTQVAAMARLQDPRLVPLLGYCIDYNEATLQMEQIIVSQFMPNGDLSQWTMPGAKPMSLRVRLAVLVDVADGLSFLHSRRIVHRDVKPANVLLDADMRVRLVKDPELDCVIFFMKLEPVQVLQKLVGLGVDGK